MIQDANPHSNILRVSHTDKHFVLEKNDEKGVVEVQQWQYRYSCSPSLIVLWNSMYDVGLGLVI